MLPKGAGEQEAFALVDIIRLAAAKPDHQPDLLCLGRWVGCPR